MSIIRSHRLYHEACKKVMELLFCENIPESELTEFFDAIQEFELERNLFEKPSSFFKILARMREVQSND